MRCVKLNYCDEEFEMVSSLLGFTIKYVIMRKCLNKNSDGSDSLIIMSLQRRPLQSRYCAEWLWIVAPNPMMQIKVRL